MSRINWKRIAQQVNEKEKVGREQLSIWGGRCGPEMILSLIKNWPTLDDMPYRIWEQSSAIEIGKSAPPKDIKWLERGRLFGEKGGDLTIRRDEDGFRWWFVGPVGISPPEDFADDDGNFWQTESDALFYKTKEKALLWGERRAKEDEQWWFEDRVANADLSYPVEGTPSRVQIKYNTYSRAGQVEFVWLYRLSEWKEENNHG